MSALITPMTPELREALGPLAARLYEIVAREGAPSANEVPLAAALVMRAVLEGHSCLTLEAVAQEATACGVKDLNVAALRAALKGHLWVSDGAGPSPLILEDDQLYLRRFHDAEVRVARAITKLAEEGRFRVITGGPGTGKTTRVATILAELLERNPYVRIGLAAPTGKAATRMGEAIEAAWAREGKSHLHTLVQPVGTTLHRLLKYLPLDDTFRRNGNDPLEHDVVIVDEASMVPLLLMDVLLGALRPSARLYLLGDHHQLTSVETGSVLADIVHAGEQGVLAGSLTRLTKSHRFDDTKGIGALARAIRDGDADAAIAVLRSGDATLEWNVQDARDEGWIATYAAAMDAVFDAESAAEALQRIGAARVLCATNVGPAGTEAIVLRVEHALRKRGRSVSGRQYRGRPLLITRNDYTLQLFNGDVGVVWDEVDESGVRTECAFIAGASAAIAPHGILLPQVPEAVTAWAMSIHKSQGSEFDTVYVVLPDRDARVVSRELLYTAVTRARSRVVLVGSEEMLRKAIERTARRGSGLGRRLV
jgi:exodeoxyribonuclease V alpha subunit